jgi:hypothetical protein
MFPSRNFTCRSCFSVPEEFLGVDSFARLPFASHRYSSPRTKRPSEEFLREAPRVSASHVFFHREATPKEFPPPLARAVSTSDGGVARASVLQNRGRKEKTSLLRGDSSPPGSPPARLAVVPPAWRPRITGKMWVTAPAAPRWRAGPPRRRTVDRAAT